jgi:hypothetical protein
VNRVLLAWTLLVASALGLILCLALFFTDRISDRTQLAVTLALSWFAITITALDVLFTAHVRDDIE